MKSELVAVLFSHMALVLSMVPGKCWKIVVEERNRWREGGKGRRKEGRIPVVFINKDWRQYKIQTEFAFVSHLRTHFTFNSADQNEVAFFLFLCLQVRIRAQRGSISLKGLTSPSWLLACVYVSLFPSPLPKMVPSPQRRLFPFVAGKLWIGGCLENTKKCVASWS